MLERVWRLLKENFMLVAILLCVSFSILSCSYFFGYFISPDSSHYLRAARAILQGNGFYLYPGWWFAIWPIGYPFLIAATSFITHTELYLASRILSILIVWIIGFSLFKRFGRTAWAYALVMFNFGFLAIFYYPWSEVPFILGLILFSFWVSDIITKDTVHAIHYVKLTLAALLLFLSRYVGAFSLGVIGLLWIYNMYLTCRYKDRTAWKRIQYITVSGVVSGIVMVSYLMLNQKMTGYMTGMNRVPNQTKALFLNLCEAQLAEMNNVFTTFFKIDSLALALPLWFCFFAFVLYTLFKKNNMIKVRDRNIITPITFIIMGGLYWCSIVAMRFSAEFDIFSYRLLFPSSVLLFIGFVGLLSCYEKINTFFIKFSGFSSYSNMEKGDKSGQSLAVWVISFFFLFTMTVTVIMPGFTSKVPSYQQMRESLLSRYADIPDGSTVLWGMYLPGERFFRFMRDDLEILNNAPFLKNEAPEAFLNRLSKGGRKIYIDTFFMKKRIDTDLKGNKAMADFFGQYGTSKETVIRIK